MNTPAAYFNPSAIEQQQRTFSAEYRNICTDLFRAHRDDREALARERFRTLFESATWASNATPPPPMITVNGKPRYLQSIEGTTCRYADKPLTADYDALVTEYLRYFTAYERVQKEAPKPRNLRRTARNGETIQTEVVIEDVE